MVADPMDRARALIGALGPLRSEVRLIGGLAVRAWLGELARTSLDVDLVAFSPEAHAAVLGRLRAEGFRIGESGGWWRCVRTTASGRDVVDLARHPVVNPRTFDTMELRAPPRTDEHGLVIAGVDDLVYMKLCAGRDQDLVDVCLLAAHCTPDAASIAKAARADDVERTVARSVLEGRHAAARGWLDGAFEELLGRAAERSEVGAFEELLRRLVEEEGL
jgi:hypothetical protein